MLLTISGETMCGGHQRTLSNRRLPSSQSKPTAVDRKKSLLHQLGKTPPRASKIQQERKETEERLSEVPPRGACLPSQTLLLQACACAPVNKTDHQCWTATHVDIVNSTRPHELRVISVVHDAKLAHVQSPPSRSRVPTNAPNYERGLSGPVEKLLCRCMCRWCSLCMQKVTADSADYGPVSKVRFNRQYDIRVDAFWACWVLECM